MGGVHWYYFRLVKDVHILSTHTRAQTLTAFPKSYIICRRSSELRFTRKHFYTLPIKQATSTVLLGPLDKSNIYKEIHVTLYHNIQRFKPVRTLPILFRPLFRRFFHPDENLVTIFYKLFYICSQKFGNTCEIDCD